MADDPEKTETKHPAEMTGDEIMDRVFDPKVREKLKKLAREHRKDEPND